MPRHTRQAVDATFDVATGLADLADLPVVGVVFLVPAVIALLLALVIGLPVLLLIVVGVVASALSTLGAVIARLVLRRPWTVDAVSGHEIRTWPVVGLRRAAAWRDELGRRFIAGDDPTPDVVEPTSTAS